MPKMEHSSYRPEQQLPREIQQPLLFSQPARRKKKIPVPLRSELRKAVREIEEILYKAIKPLCLEIFKKVDAKFQARPHPPCSKILEYI